MALLTILRHLKYKWDCFWAEYIVECKYCGILNYKEHLRTTTGKMTTAYMEYFRRYGGNIGLNAVIKGKPVLPHGFCGIRISDQAVIGKNCTIFQYASIASNTLKGHPRYGAPVIGDNVLIGNGARIVGHVHIGDNCRIGAGCVVAKDMPANTTAVSETRFIHHDEVRDNTFHSINEE